MKVLVTGGSGFIGSHVIDCLLAKGFAVRSFDLVYPKFHGSEIEFYQGSLLDVDALGMAMTSIEAVFHLAAAADVNDVVAYPDYAEKINVRGTFNVLEASRQSKQVKRVVYGGTTWVYSNSSVPEGAQANEETHLGPPDHLYTATKIAGEFYCRSYSQLYDLPTVVLRYGIPYGERARPAGVLPIFVRRAVAGEKITISGDGSQFRKFVYVKDLAEGNVAALKCPDPFRIYNLDGTEQITIRQMADTVCRVVGDVPIEHTEARAGDFGGIDVNSDRAKKELGWTATTSFEDGVARYVDWYREDQSQQQADLDRLDPEFRHLLS